MQQEFASVGFCFARGLFADRVDEINEHFATIHQRGVDGRYEPDREAEDPLDRYPRVMHPHRYDDQARAWMVDEGIMDVLAALFGEEPLAAQAMYYFKAPGSRGQSLHQDQFYLQVTPGTCIAAWIALDRVDHENGGLMVVPHTHDASIDCSKVGRPGSYNGGPSIPIPDGKRAIVADMEAGDVLFFNGSLIHGSGPNRSTDRWRRAFIGHYVGESCGTISKGYLPLVDRHGNDVTRDATSDGGPCGLTVKSAH